MPVRYADSQANYGKAVGSRLYATSTPTHASRDLISRIARSDGASTMAELSHDQLWHVCQRKPSDFDPFS